MFRKIVTSIIVFPFLIVPLLCCCTQPAMASSVGVEHCQDSQDEHSAKHDQSEHHSGSCDCAHTLNASIEKITAFQVVLPSSQSFSADTNLVKPFVVSSLKASIHLAYLGPPLGSATAVPLYTLHHSLRI